LGQDLETAFCKQFGETVGRREGRGNVCVDWLSAVILLKNVIRPILDIAFTSQTGNVLIYITSRTISVTIVATEKQ
jgi:hypothetical protein